MFGWLVSGEEPPHLHCLERALDRHLKGFAAAGAEARESLLAGRVHFGRDGGDFDSFDLGEERTTMTSRRRGGWEDDNEGGAWMGCRRDGNTTPTNYGSYGGGPLRAAEGGLRREGAEGCTRLASSYLLP